MNDFWEDTLKELFVNNFQYNEQVDVYRDIAINRDLSRVPLLFQVHLQHPERYGKFLNMVLSTVQQVRNPNMPLYKGANFFTLICCGTFHLCKIRHMYKTDEPLEEIAKWYLQPFSKFLDNLFANSRIVFDCSQRVANFQTPYTYLMLTSFCGRHMKFSDVPLVKFVDAITFDVDFLNEVVKPLLSPQDDMHAKDIFDLDLRLIYEDGELVNNYIVDQSLFVNIENDNASENMIYLSLEQLAKASSKNRAVYKFVQNIFTHHLTISQFKLMIFLNINTTDFLYDFTEQNMVKSIVYNEKWEFVLDMLWRLIENSDKLEADIPNMFLNLFDFDTIMSYEFYIYKKQRETILFPLLANRYFDENSKYIKKLMKCVLNNEWSTMPYGDELELIFNANQIIGLNGVHRDLLLTLLESKFPKSLKRRLDMSSVKSLSRNKAIFDIEDEYSLGSVSNSPDVENLHKDMKIIIKNLLRYVITSFNSRAYANPSSGAYDRRKIYFEELFKYKTTLKNDANIDLDRFGLSIAVINTPPKSVSRRSVDVSIDKINALKSPDLVQHIDMMDEGADWKPKFNNFYNKRLMHKLIKLYNKSVLNTKDDGKCKFTRILDIQKYFNMKYKPKINYLYIEDDPDIHFIRDVEVGKELSILYDFWQNELNFGNLNVKYRFEYKNSSATDVYGLIKDFFSHAAEQIGEVFFVAVENSLKRRKLRDDISVRDAEFVGQCLALFLIYESRITFNLPIFYLGHMMFGDKILSYEELFLYFILDLDDDKIKEQYLLSCYQKPDEPYDITEDLCHPETFVEYYANIKYNYKAETFKAFVSGFFIDKKVFLSKYRKIDDKIRIYDIDKILSQYKFSETDCKLAIFDKLILTIDNSPLEDKTRDEATVYRYLEELFLVDKDFSTFYNACPNNAANKSDYEKKEDFCKAILVFWSGITGLSKDDYTINIMRTVPPGAELIGSNICFNHMDIPLKSVFPEKQDLYNYFMGIFVAGAHRLTNKA